jgi:ribosomal protein L7/L12
LGRQVAFLLDHLGLEYREEPNAGVSPEILDLVRRGDTIGAIRLYREDTGFGLKEAKEFIESLEA